MFILCSSPFIAFVRALQTNSQQVFVHLCLYVCPSCKNGVSLPDIVSQLWRMASKKSVTWATSFKNQGIIDVTILRWSAIEPGTVTVADEF